MSSGAENIVSNIMSEAQNKADGNIQEAQSQADTITKSGEKKAEAAKNQILVSGKKQADMRHQQIISEAKMNARRFELEAKEEVINAAFDKATNDLKNIASTDKEEYTNALVEMIKESATEIGGGELIIQLKEEDIPKIKSNLDVIAAEVKAVVTKNKKDQLNLKSMAKTVSASTGTETKFVIGEPINTIGGVIVKTKNGEIEVNNTIESRMLRNKKELRSEVAKILFK
jgi:V/A-type H+-transporting ATPase subunit E